MTCRDKPTEESLAVYNRFESRFPTIADNFEYPIDSLTRNGNIDVNMCFDSNLKSEKKPYFDNHLFFDYITHIFDYNEGSIDDRPWCIFGKGVFGGKTLYFTYISGCSYSGLSYSGGMCVYMSSYFERVLSHFVPIKNYQKNWENLFLSTY
jgi:hypothetical protein